LSNRPGELPPGVILQNRYVIIGIVGGGGMGTVYKARDNRIANRVVAIKEMKQTNLDNEQLEQARKRFEREAAILSLVQNEHLPRIHDYFEERGRYYLVMEFLEGETLLQKLEQTKRPLPALLVVYYAIQLCDALTHLHTQRDPIIFRDLKPSNIMIRPDSHVFLIDFGIARNFKAGHTSDTEIMGTRGYMAPEMVMTQTDARSDLFSLGVTMYYCLTRQIPDYIDPNTAFLSLLTRNAEAPRELNTLILQMMQFTPGARPGSAAEVKQQLERVYRQMQADQGSLGQDVQPSGLRDRSFYVDETETWSPSIPLHNQRRSSLATALEKLPGLLLSGLLRPLTAGASKLASVAMSSGVRRDLYDRYLFLRVRLNNTGVWTTRFLFLLLSMLIGTIVLSSIIYTHFGSSIYRVEFGLAFVLLVTIILAGGQLNNPAPRNIMLCTGFFVTIAFLTLLASTTFQTASDGSPQPITLNLLTIYGLVTLTLIVLLGNIAIRKHYKQYVQGPKPAHVFTRLNHAGIAAVAGVCFLLQFAFGSKEQIIFFPSTFHPFAQTISPTATFNIVPLILLGSIGVISLLRFPQPFGGFDRAMIFMLCLLYLPLQYTFGLSELNQASPGVFQPGLVGINILIFIAPLLLAVFAFFPLPDQMAWIRLLPLFAVSLGVGWLQGFLGEREPFSVLSSNSHQITNSLPHLAIFGQVVFFSLAIAIALLFIGVIFYRRRIPVPARARWQNTSTGANNVGASRTSSAADRIGILGVTLGCGAVQWAFWQSMLQQAPALSSTAQGINQLYAPLLSLGTGYTAMGIAILTTGLVAASTLFNPSHAHSFIEGLVKFTDRVTVLGVAVISLLLLSSFGNNGGLLANSINLSHLISSGSTSSAGSDFTIHYSLIPIILIGLFGLIALFRLKRAFGWVERTLMLLCGVGAMLMLTDTVDVQQLPLLSANVQQAAGNFFSSLSADQIVALSVLIAALLSFTWLLSTNIVSDRVALAIIFGFGLLFALIDAVSAHQMLLIIALVVMIQGVLIAAKVERVRRGNATNAA
jgi:serine/threonine protein kinase